MSHWRSGFGNFQRRMAGVRPYYGGTYYHKWPTTLTRDGKMLVLGFQYNAALIARIKADIPSFARTFRPPRYWRIIAVYEPVILRLVKDVLGEDVQIREKDSDA